MTNKQFTNDLTFLKYCEVAKVKATSRQASKFRNKKGSAYRASKIG